MAWKVIGALPEAARAGTKNPFYGPMPCKVWINDGKRYRVARVKPCLKSAEAPNDYNARRAGLYARWLAERDGIVIPATATHTCESELVSLGTGARERRIKSVSFYCERTSYRDTRGDYLVTVQIPHWDFVPREPIEETLDDIAALPLAA